MTKYTAHAAIASPGQMTRHSALIEGTAAKKAAAMLVATDSADFTAGQLGIVDLS